MRFSDKKRAVLQKTTSPEQLMRECALLGNEMGLLHWLTEGVSPDAADKNGNTALHFAAQPRIIALLAEAGADINARRYEGRTALHNAVDSENIELARLLLSHGANRDARDDYGQTPLRLAVDTTGTYVVVAPKMARFLIESGADVSARDNFGETILGHAAHYLVMTPDDEPSQGIFDLLYEYGAIRD